MNFTISRMEHLEEFEFQGIRYKMEKLKNFALIRRFREVALPIIASHFEPIERLITGSANEFLVDWELVSTTIGSEIRIDKFLIPCFAVILSSKNPDLVKQGETNLEQSVTDIDWLYQVVYSQIKLEGILNTFIARRLRLFDDVKTIMELPDNFMKSVVSNKRFQDLISRIGVATSNEVPGEVVK